MNQVNKITSTDCAEGFILDGYPRTLTQSDFLLSFFDKNNLTIDFVFNFKLDFEIVKNRIIQRSQKEKRSDDNIDIVKTRLEKYMKETFPVSVIFSDKFASNYFSIDASQEISEIQKELLNILKKGEN